VSANRAPGWLPTRILLAIGIGSVVVIGFGLLVQLGLPDGFSDPRPPLSIGPLSVPFRVLLSIVEIVVPVVGLIWMIRIFRGPSDEPPPWRYRAR
jgi:hypothetical protein